MLTCGRWQFLDRAVLSVVGQRFHAWELIVIHDGDDRRVTEAMAEWVRRDPRIRYFNRPTRGNIANACNFGLLQASGDYVAILDDDDYWVAPDKLERQVEFLDHHPDYVACGGGMIVADRHRTRVQSQRPPGIAEPPPSPDGVTGGSRRQSGWRRPARHPVEPDRQDSRDRRLLQHDLADQHAPR